MNDLNVNTLFEPKTYTISDEFIKRTKYIYLTIMIMLPVGIIGILFLTLGPTDLLNTGNFIFYLTSGIIIFLELELLTISRIMLKKIKQNTLTIEETFLQRKSKILESPLEFKSIKKLTIKYNPNNSVNFIDIKAPNQSIRLCGFENMEEIAPILKTNASHAEITEHTYKLNYNSPVVCIVIFFVSILCFYLVDSKSRLPINDIFSVGLALWMLLFKPISKAQGKRFRAFEIVCGSVIIICKVFSYITKYLL